MFVRIKAETEAQEFFELLLGCVARDIEMVREIKSEDSCQVFTVRKNKGIYKLKVFKDSQNNIFKAELFECIERDGDIYTVNTDLKKIMKITGDAIEVHLTVKRDFNQIIRFKVNLTGDGKVIDSTEYKKTERFKPRSDSSLSYDIATAIYKKLKKININMSKIEVDKAV